MYNMVGTCQCGIDFEYLESTLTDRGIAEDSIKLNQFFRIKEAMVSPDKKIIIFDCDVFEHLIN